MWNKDPSYYWLSTRFVTKSIWLLKHSHKICLAFWILNMISKVSISIFWGSHPCSPHVLNPASHSTPQQIEKTGQTPDKTKRLFKLIKTQGLGKTQEVIAENGKKKLPHWTSAINPYIPQILSGSRANKKLFHYLQSCHFHFKLALLSHCCLLL